MLIAEIRIKIIVILNFIIEKAKVFWIFRPLRKHKMHGIQGIKQVEKKIGWIKKEPKLLPRANDRTSVVNC